MAYKRNVEIFEEAYEKKNAKSVVSYVARDGRKRYIAGNKNPDGGGTPMPSGGGITEVTWQELKDKRDNGKLKPGSLYRITDYNCTTTQENTQSAGHQFDIVLLALSANKLAEEGWAMEHPIDIYDVTFADGVKKCYIYPTGNNEYNVVDIETLLGIDQVDEFEEIDEINKTAILTSCNIALLDAENLQYSYFQNSNLSAWKVWYCLDNDTARFAWADDSVDEDSPATMVIASGKEDIPTTRNPTDDMVVGNTQYYAWRRDGHTDDYYTLSQTPEIGDDTFEYAHEVMVDYYPVKSYTPAHEGTGFPNGRGVIYRLIDEWGNDVPYDFKNIQIEKTGAFYYLFSAIDSNTNEIFDCSSQAFDGAPSTGNVISMPSSHGAMNLPTGYFMGQKVGRITSARDNLVLGLNFIIDNYPGIQSSGKIIGYSFYK